MWEEPGAVAGPAEGPANNTAAVAAAAAVSGGSNGVAQSTNPNRHYSVPPVAPTPELRHFRHNPATEDLHAWSIYRQNLNSDFTDSALGMAEKSQRPFGNFQLRESTVQTILNHPKYGPRDRNSELAANIQTYLRFGLPRVHTSAPTAGIPAAAGPAPAPAAGARYTTSAANLIKDTSSGYDSSDDGRRRAPASDAHPALGGAASRTVGSRHPSREELAGVEDLVAAVDNTTAGGGRYFGHSQHHHHLHSHHLHHHRHASHIQYRAQQTADDASLLPNQAGRVVAAARWHQLPAIGCAAGGGSHYHHHQYQQPHARRRQPPPNGRRALSGATGFQTAPYVGHRERRGTAEPLYAGRPTAATAAAVTSTTTTATAAAAAAAAAASAVFAGGKLDWISDRTERPQASAVP